MPFFAMSLLMPSVLRFISFTIWSFYFAVMGAAPVVFGAFIDALFLNTDSVLDVGSLLEPSTAFLSSLTAGFSFIVLICSRES